MDGDEDHRGGHRLGGLGGDGGGDGGGGGAPPPIGGALHDTLDRRERLLQRRPLPLVRLQLPLLPGGNTRK